MNIVYMTVSKGRDFDIEEVMKYFSVWSLVYIDYLIINIVPDSFSASCLIMSALPLLYILIGALTYK